MVYIYIYREGEGGEREGGREGGESHNKRHKKSVLLKTTRVKKHKNINY